LEFAKKDLKAGELLKPDPALTAAVSSSFQFLPDLPSFKPNMA